MEKEYGTQTKEIKRMSSFRSMKVKRKADKILNFGSLDSEVKEAIQKFENNGEPTPLQPSEANSETVLQTGLDFLRLIEDKPRNVPASAPGPKLSEYPLDILYNPKMEKLRRHFVNMEQVHPIELNFMKAETTGPTTQPGQSENQAYLVQYNVYGHKKLNFIHTF